MFCEKQLLKKFMNIFKETYFHIYIYIQKIFVTKLILTLRILILLILNYIILLQIYYIVLIVLIVIIVLIIFSNIIRSFRPKYVINNFKDIRMNRLK